MSDEEERSMPLSSLRSEIDEEQAGDEGAIDSESPEAQTEGTQPDAGDTDTGDSPDSIPLAGLRNEAQRRERQESSQSAVDEAFVEEAVDPVDSEGVWADLLMESGAPEGEFRASEGGEDTQVISKRICERCEYVNSPPELACTHEGTTIHELVDVDRVRVSNCPMVGPDGETTNREESAPDG